MSDRAFSRRDFLATLGVAGAAGAVLTACGGTTDQPAPQSATDREPMPADPGAPRADGAGDVVASECPGYDNLSQDQRNIRQTLNYQDVSPQSGQYCDNCRFLVEDAALSPCIGCQLFEGPVAPRGWCSSWAAL